MGIAKKANSIILKQLEEQMGPWEKYKDRNPQKTKSP